jgi:acyl-CoA thioesterase FadM
MFAWLAATVKPWHIMALVESGRALSFNSLPNHPNQTPFLHAQHLYNKYAFFQGSMRLNVSKEMYDLDLLKTPLTLEKELVYVGKSSVNIHTDVILDMARNPVSGTEGSRSRSEALTLASCEVQSVLIDRQTRRPTPYPDSWRADYGACSKPDRQLVVKVVREPSARESQNEPGPHSSSSQLIRSSLTSGLPVPDGVSSYKLTVCDSDTDAYGHANWSPYLKFCLDALKMASLQDPTSTQEFKKRAVKRADIAYINEGNVAQDIRVKFWKDSEDGCCAHFSIEDFNSGDPITYALIQFYSLEEVALPVSTL